MRLNQKSRNFPPLLSGAIIPHSHLKHEEENGEVVAYFFLFSLTSSIVLPRMYYICADISLLLLSSLPSRGRGKEERGLPRGKRREVDSIRSHLRGGGGGGNGHGAECQQKQGHDLWSVPCLFSISGSDGGAHNDITRFHTKKIPDYLIWEVRRLRKISQAK